MSLSKTANEVRSYVKKAQVAKTLSNLALGSPWAPAEAGRFARNSEMYARLMSGLLGAGAGAIGGASIGGTYALRNDISDAEIPVLLGALIGGGLGGMVAPRLGGFQHELGRHLVDTIGGAIPG